MRIQLDTKHTLTPERQREALLGALLQATANLTQGHDVETILRSFCDALVAASPHIRMAWIYLGEPDPDIIRPTYSAGPARPHPETLAIGRDPAAMQGPARRTLATGKPVVMQVVTDPGFALWRDSALAQGLRSVASIAFRAPGSNQAGLIAVGADTDDYFEQVGLEPIIAFARLGEMALAQAADRHRLEELATFDHLTGLLNRRALETLLTLEHARARRHTRPYSLLLFDIDRFKLINDSYGHGVGDQVLARLAQIIRGALRQSDSVARWGGEEFLCLLPETNCDEAMLVAEHLRHHIAGRPVQIDERMLRMTVSIGLACFPTDGEKIETLLSSADAALYTAKHSGRNRLMRSEAGAQGIYFIGAQIEEALAQERLRAAYQPIVELHSGRTVGEEALARIQRPGEQVLEADYFIEAANRLQLAHQIDYEIIRQAIRRCTVRMLSGAAPILHFVNASADLLRHPNLVEDILECARQACSACGGKASDVKPLVVELTGRELLADMREIKRILAPLTDFGLRLAIDDFGSGHSSYRYLADLPIAFLKIERKLTLRVKSDTRIRAIIKGIQATAVELGLITLAEGVEDADTARVLNDLGVNWAQGYYFGAAEIA